MHIGESFARDLIRKGDVILLGGELGTGKTIFTKGIAHAFGIAEDEITSPTFSLVNEYDIRFPDGSNGKLYHLDCYRFEHPDELLELGIEYLHPVNAVTIVEWYERLGPYIPKNGYTVQIEEQSPTTRSITIRR